MNYFNYFTEVEETFIRRRGKALFLNSKDWTLIDSWKDRGIPLHIVLRAIEQVFDKAKGAVSTLYYCSSAVESEYKGWLDSQVGSSGEEVTVTFGNEAIAQHIQDAIVALQNTGRPEIADDVQRGIQRLADLQTNLNGDPETIDRSLGDIENSLNLAMLTNWKKDELGQFENRVHEQLKSYKDSMEADVYQSTFDLMLLKSLREASGIPRLGLFYL